MERHRKLIVDDLLTRPSAVSPMLFVGLGGCGCRMVARVARHLRARPDFQERYRDLVKVALVDTNVNDLESYREIADDTFLLSDFEKEQYANLASGKLFLEADPYFTQWVPPNYRFRAGDTAGAGQIRLESRLGLFYQMKHKGLVPRFRRLLESLKSHQHGHRRLDSSEIRIIVCFSVAGGTGSGCHLPIAYMLRDYAREVGRPWMMGVAVLPAVFEEKVGTNRDGTFANGYAALKEIEHLMRLGAPGSPFYPEEGFPFHYDPSDESKRNVRQRPFELVYVVDKPESFSVPEPVDAAADGLYLQLFSPLFGAQAADYDNYTQHQRFLVPHDFEEKGILGFSTFYGSFGAAVLLVPVPGLVDYCSQSAALSLMRASFLGEIPGDPVYAAVRLDPDSYHEVTASDDKNEKPVRVADFLKKTPQQRDILLDRLYMKRVRLLAASELAEGVEKRFMTLFRHGHRVGEVPQRQGGFEYREERVKADQQQIGRHGMQSSIASVVLPAIAGRRPGDRPGLLEQAQRAIEEYARENRMPPGEPRKPIEFKVIAEGWVDDFRRVGIRILKNGYKEGTVSYPGMDSLVDLDFLTGEAGGIDLAAKRYAALCILDQIRFEKPLPRSTDFVISGDFREHQPIKSQEDRTTVIEDLERQAIARAVDAVARQFGELLGELQQHLMNFASLQRSLEQSFADLQRDRSHRLDRLRQEGDSSTNQYILDAEALQIEDGRRMWDFYYEDRVADLPELSLGNPRVQQVLSDTVTNLSVSGGSTTTTGTLDQLFTALVGYARELLQAHIGGDPHSPDRERRDGLTLAEALELEVVYRALYRSNVPQIQKEGSKAIRQLVHEYRHTPQKLDLGEPRHSDYLRDKIRRVLKEKASLLCLYEESRDQHGGVRPNEVFLAAIGESFRGSRIEEAIKGADIPHLTWVSEGWQNPKEIIFYRAILNVPLYAFGRMDKMKHSYDQFRRMAKRSKALHIDRNWEDELPDLDPVSVQDEHRQKLVRQQIVNFATLLVIPNPNRAGHGYILRREGRYMLCDPGFHSMNGASGEDGLAVLGTTMAQAVERLPEVLNAERVKYFSYQQMLQAVREGLAPRVLGKIVRLPVRWRKNAEGLHDLYGSKLGLLEQAKFKDYENAYRRLHESLEDLLDRLRNKKAEQESLGEEAAFQLAGVSTEQARENLSQSIHILEEFCRKWEQMENPDQARGSEVARSFRDLFLPLPAGELNDEIDLLRQTFGDQGTNGAHTPAPTPAEGGQPSIPSPERAGTPAKGPAAGA